MSLCRFARKLTTFRVFSASIDANLERNFNVCLRFCSNDVRTKVKLQNSEIVKEVTNQLKGFTILANENPFIINYLRKYQFDDDEIISSLVKYPDFLTQTDQDLKIITREMTGYGLTTKQALRLLTQECNLSTTSGRDILRKVTAELKSIGIEMKLIYRMMTEHPALISTDPEHVKKVSVLLRKYFTKAEAANVMTKCPNVLTDDPTETTTKIRYAYDKMGVSTKLMSQCDMMRHTARDIFCRHKYLERAGAYKRTDPKVVPTADGTNPLVKDIFSTSDKNFARKVAQCRPAEYLAFVAIVEHDFQAEMKQFGYEAEREEETFVGGEEEEEEGSSDIDDGDDDEGSDAEEDDDLGTVEVRNENSSSDR